MPDAPNLQMLIEQYRDRPWCLVSPGGNWGDHLIWAGAELLARKFCLDYRSVSIEQFANAKFSSDYVIYVHGGGGYNPYASGNVARALLHALTTHEGIVIQGPQTIDTSASYIESLVKQLPDSPTSERSIFFARERSTFEVLATMQKPWLETLLDIDTALHLTRESYLCLAGTSAHERYGLIAFREDNEAPTFVRVPTDYRKGVKLDPALYASTFEHWLRIHANAKWIVTNRTHSAISGAILGKPTVMGPGAYHKNASIWEYGLRERGVDWLGSDSPSSDRDEDDSPWMLVPQRLRNSWKVRRIIHYVMGVPMK